MTTLDTGTDHLLATVERGVAVLTLNRPHRRNAFSPEMIAALGATLKTVRDDDEVGAVLLTGSGTAFGAGGDVKEMVALDPVEFARTIDDRIAQRRRDQDAIVQCLWDMPKPTIAAIAGPAAGAALSLALACDLRYATRDAALCTSFVRVGLSGDYGGTWLLTQLIGAARAKELYYSGEKVSAHRALGLGLVNDVLYTEGFHADVRRRAERLAAGPRLALGSMKKNINAAAHTSLAENLEAEATDHLRTQLTQDHREGALSFVEKREPRFRGR